MIAFPLSGLELFNSFPSNIYVFIDFFKGFIDFSFKDLYHIHNGCFKAFYSVLAMLEYSGPAGLGLLGSSGDIFVLALIDCVFMLVSMHLGLR